MTYDAAGNLTNDTYTGAGNRTYDGENKITSAWGGNNQAQLYAYDATGQRIKRTVDGVETWQVYGLGGELLAEYPANGDPASPQKEYGYRNGQLLITASSAVSSSNHSLSLNGTSAYVQVPNSSSLNITGSITVEAWVKPNSIGAYQDIASRETYGVSGTGGGYELTLNNLGKARFDLYHSHNSYTPVIGNTVLTTGVWHHIAAVWDGTYMRLYVNGVLDATVTNGNGPASGTSSLKLGRNSGGNHYNGLIDEVRISNAAVYTSNFTPQTNLSATATTKGLWKFDGQVVTDASTNGNDGTLQGGASYSDDVPSGDGGGGSSGSSSGGGAAKVHWLVSDHLGTPRMIFDVTGRLDKMTRHDYLPFGEELFAPTGGRTAAMGYAGGDGVRQQFTLKERDVETGLDYFINRYYSSMQGRFTSPDVPFADQREEEPQSWNLYSYVGNQPLNHTDPFGLWKEVECSSGKKQCWESDNKKDTVTSLAKILGVDADQLNQFLQNPTVKLGQTFDISGFWSWRAGITGPPPAVVVVDVVDEDEIPGDKYSIEFTIGPRFPIRDIGKKAAQKLWNERGNIAKQLTQEDNRLLREFFRQGTRGKLRDLKDFQIPQGLTKQALERYAEIARRAVESGNDKSGVQRDRLQLIEKALQKMD